MVRDRKTTSIFTHQEKYATKVLNRSNHRDAHPVRTTTTKSVKLCLGMRPQTDSEKNEMKAIPYREVVGSFMYLMMETRTDLDYFLRERDFRYFNSARKLGITLDRIQNVEQYNLQQCLTAYLDAGYANYPDTRRSVGGYITYMCGSSISWQSMKHHTVVLYTTEAEYIALYHCMQELMFLDLLLQELNHNSPHAITIYEDNQSCIKLSYNPELHDRSKHIHIRYCFVQEKVNRKEFDVKYCNTKEMVADIFTKSLTKTHISKTTTVTLQLVNKLTIYETLQNK
ncbi:Integrase catalytic core protein [Phytophthora palmivora]|uniref:Integrase catalytic core protein n=1 Tax=Phytophthora palmivora TaxID=4796 RepID=A0A2P4YVT2_9STRA|nr:Integrase catalytic core protein [Phytophthora palmivora]